MAKTIYDNNFERFAKNEIHIGVKDNGCEIQIFSRLDNSRLLTFWSDKIITYEKKMEILRGIHDEFVKNGETQDKMTLDEIKQAVLDGKKVYWENPSYQVIVDSKNQWLIKHTNGHCIGLTWDDDVTMNGKPEDFHIM